MLPHHAFTLHQRQQGSRNVPLVTDVPSVDSTGSADLSVRQALRRTFRDDSENRGLQVGHRSLCEVVCLTVPHTYPPRFGPAPSRTRAVAQTEASPTALDRSILVASTLRWDQ